MSKVTVLMAVYNSEKYLPACLESLTNQTLYDIQIVCIDDASTDQSLSILCKYAFQDKRIQVISLAENRGQAHARNIGLQKADGEFICFLDSDDWLSADALQQAVSVFEANPDTGSVLFRVVNHYSDEWEEEYPMQDFDKMSGGEAFEKSLTWGIHGVYMVRADIHLRYPYDETSHAYSDDNTTRLHYLASKEVRRCNGIYYYRQHMASVTHQMSIHRFDYLRANESMKRQLQQLKAPDRLINLYENVRWLNVIDVYMFYFLHRQELSASDCSRGLSEIKRIWKSIELFRLTKCNKYKFGYMPLRFSWYAFCLQEEIYFRLRFLIRKH
ncbi:MAG: glycosyltransferase family 2 protein [Prevotella sp.]|nr:glycosyltransferase family 2 protein [Prevotella sp.]